MGSFSNKTLKLINVLKYELQTDRDEDINVVIEQMSSYIRVKGAMQIGPLIQYTDTQLDEDGNMNMKMSIMMQCNTFIHNVESPYTMESTIRIPNAMYCRFNGREDELHYAFSKIHLESYESDEKLSGNTYTIFVDEDEDGENITADVFIPRAEAV